jgi:hypothetical protein
MYSGANTSTSCTNRGKDSHRFYNYGFTIPTDATIAGAEVCCNARPVSTANTSNKTREGPSNDESSHSKVCRWLQNSVWISPGVCERRSTEVRLFSFV